MICQDISARLNSLTLSKNIPAAATLELTRRCPLSCAHCYLPETSGRRSPAEELATLEWFRIMDSLAEAGTLYLVFTGGEPLLRGDIHELCAYARKKRFDVRIFSTAIGLTDEIAVRFRESGLSAFEISVYGRPEIHDGITGAAGSFEKSLSAARLLVRRGVKVRLKTPLMVKNFGEINWLKSLADTEGFSIAFDPVISAADDGNGAALSLRLSREQLLDIADSFGADLQAVPAGNAGEAEFGDFPCGAGRNVCAVGADGSLYPCLQLPVRIGDLRNEDFFSVWRNSSWLAGWRSAKPAAIGRCLGCADAGYCSRCPGISYVEEGSPFLPNTPACDMAFVRKFSALRGS